LRRELEAVAAPRLARAFEVYRRLLEDWGRRAVRELQRAFEAELALLSAAARGAEGAALEVEDGAPLAADLAELERWPKAVSRFQYRGGFPG